MRTEQEIAEAIKRLEQNKAKTSRYSAFGEDNHAKLDAMLETLEQGFDDEDIMNAYGDPENGDITPEQDAAEQIAGWRDSHDGELEEYLYPE